MGILHTGLLLTLGQALFTGTWASSSTPSPGITEVDLIFPRNETYAPSPIFPFVFAIQNPSLLSTLDPSMTLDVYQQNVSANVSNVLASWINFSIRPNYSNSTDPYFAHSSPASLTLEGSFKLTWVLKMRNCSYDAEKDAAEGGYYGIHRDWVYFSIKNGAAQPDFVAATDNATCADSPAVAVTVPELLDAPPPVTRSWFPVETWGGPSCAVSPVARSPTPTPCKVKIDDEAAASISSAMTSTVCDWPISRTGMICPATATATSAAFALRAPMVGVWGLISTLFAYGLV